MTKTSSATTTGMPQPRTIRAEIAERAIRQVTSFYDATIGSIFSEIYQNARRAGATQVRVDIDRDKQTVTVTDDGVGIASPEAVLSFGRSDWDRHGDEHPAGMGLYSLSRRGAHISSRTRGACAAWQAFLEPKHFRGDEAAVVESLEATGPTGTTITFPIAENDDCPETAALTQARYLPIRVTISGTSVPQEPFMAPSRLAGIVEESDLVFGICKRDPWVNGPTTHDLTINFHGHVVTDDVRTPVVRGLDSWWTATVEVKHCPELELVLPTREKIIRNSYLTRLVERMERAIYQVIAEQPTPQSLIFEHAQRAREFGFDITVAENVLVEWAQMPADPDWHGYPARRTAPTPPDAIVVARTLNGNQAGMLERALVCEEQDLVRAGEDPGNGTRSRLFAETTDFNGFAWYDTMPKAVDLHVEIEVDGERSRVEPEDTTNWIADKVWAVLSVRRPDETIETIRIETDMGLSCNEKANYPANAGLVLSRNRPSARGEVAYAVDRALFIVSDNCADGPTTQNNEFETELHMEMTKLLDGCDAALDTAIRNALAAVPAAPAGTTVHMASVDGKAWKIETHLPENSGKSHSQPENTTA